MVRASLDNVSCKVCGSHQTVRDGKIKGVQRWECKSCGRKFLGNDARYGMKTSLEQVKTAIQMYYRGISLNTICKQLQLQYNNYASVSTVYDWIVKYNRKASAATRNLHPCVGEEWIVDETMLNVLGHQLWVWDVVDSRTGFLITSRVVEERHSQEAHQLMKEAMEKARQSPRVVITGSLGPYLKGVHQFTLKRPEGRFDSIHLILQNRNEVMSDLKRVDKVVEFIQGWLIYYNYYRPHENFNGKLPSELANVEYFPRPIDRRLNTLKKNRRPESGPVAD